MNLLNDPLQRVGRFRVRASLASTGLARRVPRIRGAYNDVKTETRRELLREPIWCLLTWDSRRYEHGRRLDGGLCNDRF